MNISSSKRSHTVRDGLIIIKGVNLGLVSKIWNVRGKSSCRNRLIDYVFYGHDGQMIRIVTAVVGQEKEESECARVVLGRIDLRN